MSALRWSQIVNSNNSISSVSTSRNCWNYWFFNLWKHQLCQSDLFYFSNSCLPARNLGRCISRAERRPPDGKVWMQHQSSLTMCTQCGWIMSKCIVVYSLDVVWRKCNSMSDTCVLFDCMYWNISLVYGFHLHMLRLLMCPHIGYVRTETRIFLEGGESPPLLYKSCPIFTSHTHR